MQNIKSPESYLKRDNVEGEPMPDSVHKISLSSGDHKIHMPVARRAMHSLGKSFPSNESLQKGQPTITTNSFEKLMQSKKQTGNLISCGFSDG